MSGQSDVHVDHTSDIQLHANCAINLADQLSGDCGLSTVTLPFFLIGMSVGFEILI